MNDEKLVEKVTKMGDRYYKLAYENLDREYKRLRSRVEELEGELKKYKQAVQTIFDDPLAYVENKSVMWKQRAESAEASLTSAKEVLKKMREAIEEYRDNPDYGLKNTIYAVYDDVREVLDGVTVR